jgi:GT2 family glycosyltransferase
MARPIHVIIVSHNTRDVLLACLASLTDHPSANVERITVVDNASTDGTVEVVRTRAGLEVLPLDHNVGFGAANNVAARQSTADFLLFLNSDTIVPAGSLDLLLERLRAAGAVAAGPRLVDAGGRPEISFGSMLTPWTEAAQFVRQRFASRSRVERLTSEERLVDWVSGACLLVDRSAFGRAGGFDERYFMYEEDVDLCAALRAGGGCILFTPKTQITHLRGRSFEHAAPAPGPSHYDRSHLAFYEKHAPHWAPWLRRWLRWRGRAIE